jgi:hypothetical protein
VERLIQEYKETRRILRVVIKKVELRLLETDDEAEEMDLINDLSLLNGMLRDVTEVIGMMQSAYHRPRGQDKVVLMDPAMIREMEIPKMREWDPETEGSLRNEVLERYGSVYKSRIHLLTQKQLSTLERWIIQEKSISEISREDGVSRTAVWIRIFGDRTNMGALKILRDGR